MRARKTILLVSENEVHAAMVQFLLETRGQYRVCVAFDNAAALELLRAKRYDLLLAELVADCVDGNELARLAKIVQLNLPVLIFSRTVNSYERASNADFFIPELHCNSEEILSRVGLLTKRKTGPKARLIAAELGAA